MSTTLGASAAPAEAVRIKAGDTREPISPYVYGQFIEHLGRCIYGGIWAEMLEDRKFYYPVDGKKSGWQDHKGDESTWQGEGVPYEILAASPWQIIGPSESVAMATDGPFVGDHDPVIALDGSSEARGIYHPRLGLIQGKAYTGHIVLKASEGVAKVEVALIWDKSGDGEDVVTLGSLKDTFESYPLQFTAGEDSNDARLAIRCYGSGSVRIGTASLMPADNVDGFRKDVLAYLRELDSPIYRWPGGNFVSGYDWRDGIGERDKRPPRKNPAWTGIEHNDVGIHEYMRLCELIDTEPFIALNTGLGDVTSAAEEVEYVTGSPDTAEGAKRAENGRKKPWDVKWWAIGNEMYGDWQLGHMPLEEYVEKHNKVVEAIREVSPEAKCIAVGAAGEWSETMLTHCADHMELISEHQYWQRIEDVTEHAFFPAVHIQRLADTHRKYREEIDGIEEKDIRIAFDEWNYWYGPYIYGELGVRYYMRDALGCAAALHTMFRNSDLFYMANYAQTVNVIGAIKATPIGVFMATTGKVLKLYRHHYGQIPVQVEHEADGVDIAAAWTEDRSALTVAIVNTRGESVLLDLSVDGATPGTKAQAWTIQHNDPDAYNDIENPNNVSIETIEWEPSDKNTAVAPYSVTLVKFPVAR